MTTIKPSQRHLEFFSANIKVTDTLSLHLRDFLSENSNVLMVFFLQINILYKNSQETLFFKKLKIKINGKNLIFFVVSRSSKHTKEKISLEN